MERIIIQTADGSHSLFVKELNENYHSVHGAVQESKHVFIEAGLNHYLKSSLKEINILEIGFGTGLNAFLTYLENLKHSSKINYSGLEAFPLESELIEQLNYIDQLNSSDNKEIFQQLHSCEWEKEISLAPDFHFTKYNNTLQSITFDTQFDIIYFDAFAPTVQPELWTEEIFKKIVDAMNPNGVLVTYCAKGIVKRALKSVGFTIETLQGTPGKREMVRATKLIPIPST